MKNPIPVPSDHVGPGAALLIIDMINTFDFPGGVPLQRHALAIAPRILRLRERLRERSIPSIYCNDNFGQWRSDFRQVFASCTEKGMRGAEIAGLLEPHHDDYFVLKPKHSAFFATPLELLLRSLEVRRLILAGIAGDSCILATAGDAHMRDLEVIVARDGIASRRGEDNERALAQASGAFDASLSTCASIARRFSAASRSRKPRARARNGKRA